jgi:hypothetical protein
MEFFLCYYKLLWLIEYELFCELNDKEILLNRRSNSIVSHSQDYYITTPVSFWHLLAHSDKKRRNLKWKLRGYACMHLLRALVIIFFGPMAPEGSIGLRQGICMCCTGSFKKYLSLYIGTKLKLKLKLNSMVLFHERTIPTERPPLVGEVIANFCG